MKRIRKSIRINGKLISKVFYSKDAAERWYIDLKHKKIFLESGTAVPLDASVTLNAYFDYEWMPNRKRAFRKATYRGDEQRYNDYVRRQVGDMPMSRIGMNDLRECLTKAWIDNGLSVQTRNRIRSMLSAVFRDALNRPEPLVRSNPITGLKFARGRHGENKSAPPKILNTAAECERYLTAARSLSNDHFTWAAITLMTGMRSSEVIGLRWGSIDFKRKLLHVRERFLASERIVGPGTKAGEKQTRTIPMSQQLINMLEERQVRSHPEDDEYVLSHRGTHINEGRVFRMCRDINQASGLDVTPHGLRHTFAREFAMRSDNLRALQQIMGHESLSMTQHYSKLDGNRLTPFAEVVSFSTEIPEK